MPDQILGSLLDSGTHRWLRCDGRSFLKNIASAAAPNYLSLDFHSFGLHCLLLANHHFFS